MKSDQQYMEQVNQMTEKQRMLIQFIAISQIQLRLSGDEAVGVLEFLLGDVKDQVEEQRRRQAEVAELGQMFRGDEPVH